LNNGHEREETRLIAGIVTLNAHQLHSPPFRDHVVTKTQVLLKTKSILLIK